MMQVYFHAQLKSKNGCSVQLPEVDVPFMANNCCKMFKYGRNWVTHCQ